MDPTGILGEGGIGDKLIQLAPILSITMILVTVVAYATMRMNERTQERTEAMLYRAIEAGQRMGKEEPKT